MEKKDPRVIEKKAYDFLVESKYEDAFHAFREAGDLYSAAGSHKESSLCFSSAASCWALRQGEKVLQNAAISYESAASEAEKAGDYEYASLLYRYAAINYEKDMEFAKYSECFFASKESQRRYLMFSVFNPKRIHNISTGKGHKWTHSIIKRTYHWLGLTFAAMLWGHGERPMRTFLFAIFIIFAMASLYTFGRLEADNEVFRPNIFSAMYFSAITFTTVGYGDINPIGLTRALAMVEAFCGVFITPLFIVGMSRKYLRV
ncbi:MAG: ion channel [Candidatus Omnitrophica bacterium]|nr:ion channel [Candidatus Omnitrophota bacterium]